MGKKYLTIIILIVTALVLCGCRMEVSAEAYESEIQKIKSAYSALNKQTLRIEAGVYGYEYSRRVIFYADPEENRIAMSSAVIEKGTESLHTLYLEQGNYYISDTDVKLIVEKDSVGPSSWITGVELLSRDTFLSCVSPYLFFDSAVFADRLPLFKLSQLFMTTYETELYSMYLNNTNLYVVRYVPPGKIYSFSGKAAYVIENSVMQEVTLTVEAVYRVGYNEYPYKAVIKVEITDQVPRLTAEQKAGYGY